MKVTIDSVAESKDSVRVVVPEQTGKHEHFKTLPCTAPKADEFAELIGQTVKVEPYEYQGTEYFKPIV